MAFLAVLAASIPLQAAPPAQPAPMSSLYEVLIRGGPVMIPLAICSVVALAWMLERALALRAARLGSKANASLLVSALRETGPARAADVARGVPTLLSAIFLPAFERWNEDRPTLEKLAEDGAFREVRGLIASLRPFTVISVCAPLLGLLGTVIGIIIAFRDIALANAMGKPEALTQGIAQALVTTATGLAIAIPTQVAYYWFRAKIDRYARLLEETGEQLFVLRGGSLSRLVAPPPPPVSAASKSPLEHGPIVAEATS